MIKKPLLLATPVSLYLVLWTSYSFYLDIPYDAKRLAEGFLLVTGAGMICISTYFQEKWAHILGELKNKRRLLISVLPVLVFIGLISAALSNYPKYAFLEISHFFLLFNLVILLVACYLLKPSWFEYFLLSTVGLMSALYLVNISISYVYTFFVPNFPLWPSTDFMRIWFEGIGFRYPKPFSNFINVRFFNQLQTWSLPLLTLLVIQIPKRYWAFSKIAFIIASAWWMLVFASGARGTLIASVISLVFVLFMYKDKAKKFIGTHSSAAVIGLVLYFLFFRLWYLAGGTGSADKLIQGSDSGRFDLWEYAIKLTLQNPLFGVGPMHYAEFNKYTHFSAPHNAYLQIFSEWGIPAGILFLAVIVIGSYKWFIRSNEVISSSSPNSPIINIRVALTASLLAALVHAMVSNILNTPMSQIMMVIVLAWMIGVSLRDEEDEEKVTKPIKPYTKYGLIGFNLLAAGFLIWCYSIQFPQLDENRRKFLIKTGTNILYPRYWDQGIIGLEDIEKDNFKRTE